MKKAYQIMSLEALEDLFHYFEIGVNIDSISMEGNGLIRMELSGDGLPVDDGSVNEKVKTQISADTSKPYYRKKSKVAKVNDPF